ncbi:MOSC domain-containing protein [Streptomyces justiciae]|uniref:MOSC N-terminal beta barrel domain-containing protein n=1 Tax=Streptomyces justiciae TaxID=2780140 RepID=A0ABU3M576_9ACTN|nr:MOSC N-terminal beta barrel domain-containing protein [Streptomyces justiciae]MDT7846650.1 MOSC N-terminal beta barrel domain-containing protein [Streptomyces justiciae]
MSPAPKAVQLWRYPVKSMGGERTDRLFLGPSGVVGDREFAVVVAATGRVLTAKREPRLLDATARRHEAGAELTLPDGRRFTTADPDADAILSDWLGQAVELRRQTGRVHTVEEYRKDPAEPSSLSTFDLPAGKFVDEAPVHLLSEGALRAAGARHPDGTWDVRRFRPNVLLSGPEADHFPGTRARIGNVLLDITEATKRCVMVTQPQRDLPKDREILRSLVQASAGTFGVYATVTRPGTVLLGDTLAAEDVAARELVR